MGPFPLERQIREENQLVPAMAQKYTVAVNYQHQFGTKQNKNSTWMESVLHWHTSKQPAVLRFNVERCGGTFRPHPKRSKAVHLARVSPKP